MLLDPACERLARLSHLWVDVGYQGRAGRWAEDVLDVSVEIVRKLRKPSRRGGQALGRGVGQGRRGSGLAQTDASEGLPGAAA